MRELRAAALLALACIASPARAGAQPLTILDVPFIAQSELLCGGAAAAMVMRYWGERGVDGGAFANLVDPRAGGIRTTALVSDLRARHWQATALDGSPQSLDDQLGQGRPVIALIEERPGTDHYVVVVARNAAGVVFHDPARAPFRVASAAEFDRRWSATGRWMLVVMPSTPRSAAVPESSSAVVSSPCDEQVAGAVRLADQNDLAAAERTLVSALSCPGAAVFRELAGLRARQERWPEAADLAAAAVSRDPSDAYGWKLLATARFVDDDAQGALEAWNRAGEPRLDLINLQGLTRTRYAVVEHLIGLKTGETLTGGGLFHARRRLGELPSGSGTLDFVPQPSGLADVRGVIAERPLVPHGYYDLGALSLATAITREAAFSVSSPTGGGERISFDWRFWAHRPLYQLSFAAPAPWRGVWGLTAAREQQPFTTNFARSVHDALHLDVADWLTGALRWQLGAGADRWNGGRTMGTAATSVRFVTRGDRVVVAVQARAWFGSGSSFHSGDVQALARSSTRPRGLVVVVNGGVSAISAAAPPDLWFAADTGRARPLLLRAHPILTEGARFRTDRLSRLLGHETTELQRWWGVGPFRIGGATFVDTARTARRLSGDALTDVDTGIGFRGAYPGKGGALRADFARGLRDGNTAFSVVYTADFAH